MLPVATLLRFGSLTACILHIVACMGDAIFLLNLSLIKAISSQSWRAAADPSSNKNFLSGCLGCDTKPKLITSVNEPLKGQKLQNWTLSKPSISEDFWTTSICDMDNSAAQSRGSISSISTSNQAHDAHGTGSGNIPSEFVNHGLLLWNQSRQHWIGNKRSENRAQQLREPKLSWNATYDSLLGSNKPFPKSIPLSEMVDFLVDIWEQEGMYD